jgi:uncharacterized protein (TIGR03085 family)
MDKQRANSWAEQVERVRRGPAFGPFAWPVVRERMYIREYLIHHEDVRRPNGLGPRRDVPELQEVAWAKVGTVGRFALKRLTLPKGIGLELCRTDGERLEFRPGTRHLRLTGEPIELLLYAFGRRSAAEVQVDGDSDAVDALNSATWAV